MKLNIERISIDEFCLEHFVFDRLRLEIPFIVTGVRACDPNRASPEYVKRHFSSESRRQMGWYDSELVDDDMIRIPPIVTKILERPEMSLREAPMRLFMQPRGHVTLPHYDGNSLHGMNLQVVGQKKWIMTSPRTPLPIMPFMFAGMVRRTFVYDPRKYDFFEFETQVGDLLFLPRYWCHEVHSLDEINLNVNWVFTPVFPNERSPLGRREVELLKLRKAFAFIDESFPDTLSEYGGRGEEITARYTENVTMARALTRFVKEVVNYPKFLVLLRELKSRAREFSENNFNVPNP